jgi:hypothetical protein
MTNAVLKKGSQGDDVRVLQGALAAAGFDPGSIDGIFGPRTERAVKAFQAFHGLAIDGVAGSTTPSPLRSLRIPAIAIRQPRPFDIVNDPILICGMIGAFEAIFQARVRDAGGNAFVDETINLGRGDGISEVHFQLATGIPPTTKGSVEVLEFSAQDGNEVNKVTVPVVFGRGIMGSYGVFEPYAVRSGDTLRSIAQSFYGDPKLFMRIFYANPHQLSDPNRMFPGQILRVPLE